MEFSSAKRGRATLCGQTNSDYLTPRRNTPTRRRCQRQINRVELKRRRSRARGNVRSDSAGGNGGKVLVGGCGFVAGGQGSGRRDAQTSSTALAAVAGPPRRGAAQHARSAHRNAVVSAGATMAVGWVRALHHGGLRQAARSAWVAAAVAVGLGVVLLALSVLGLRCASTHAISDPSNPRRGALLSSAKMGG